MMVEYKNQTHKKVHMILILSIVTIILFLACLFLGSSNMSFIECLKALVYKSSSGNNRIMWNIRMPRAIAALLCGAGLSIAGLIMQTTLGNPMASPATLGVSNASVFGANVAMILFAGGFVSAGGNPNNYFSGANPFQTSAIALIFSIICILIILGLSKMNSYSPNTVILAGIAIGSIFTAGTTFLQYFATDVGLSASVVWSFGDLSRATYIKDLVLLIVVLFSFIYFALASFRFNALLSGDDSAKSLGINVERFRFIALLVASLITAVCVSFFGIIGFVGLICPHLMKRMIGSNHKYLLPASTLAGSSLLLLSDTIARTIGNGSSLPVGAITTLLGAPFFLYIIFKVKEDSKC